MQQQVYNAAREQQENNKRYSKRYNKRYDMFNNTVILFINTEIQKYKMFTLKLKKQFR